MQVESCGIPPFAKNAKDPDFLSRGCVHGHVCGFLQGKPHEFLRNPPRPTGNPGPGPPVIFCSPVEKHFQDGSVEPRIPPLSPCEPERTNPRPTTRIAYCLSLILDGLQCPGAG